MPNLTLPYPPVPEGADKTIIKPSQSFRQEVYRSIAAIALFIITYLFLFFVAVGIGGVFCWLGINILTDHFSTMGMLAGIGLCIAGLLLVFFVIKFLFKQNNTDYSQMVEISEEEQPDLFAFIYTITTETQAQKPKRIFIAADVNASVFYDSSFWSMFLPVKKNLKIGLGLVNTVNISEFKAIMAHEFGHFSQKSMKFGSYVYNFNKVIYNMLFENDGYNNLLNQWAKMHAIFSIIAFINIKIIKGMQIILKQVYIIVNKAYLRLSREMEFHADAVAAYVSGSNQMITSLRRIELGHLCYTNLLDFWNSKLGENKRSLNFYPEHSAVMSFVGDKYNIPFDDSGLPLINNELSFINNNRVIIDDQWSSHPSNNDREAHLKGINLETAVINVPAWSLFKDAEQLQLRLTNLAYATANTTKALVVGLEDFKTDFNLALNTHIFDATYKDCFDNRAISEFNVDEAASLAATAKSITLEQLLADENCNLPIIVNKMKQDVELLNNVINSPKAIKTFDYKGTKYYAGDAYKVQAEIAKECKTAEKQIEELDRNIFTYFYNSGINEYAKQGLLNKYRNLFQIQKEAATDYILYKEIMAATKPLYRKSQPKEINRALKVVYGKEEIIKPRVKEIIGDDKLKPYITDEQLKDLRNYVLEEWIYYFNPGYNDRAITVFNKAMNAYISLMSKSEFEVKKDLLDFQVSLSNKSI